MSEKNFKIKKVKIIGGVAGNGKNKFKNFYMVLIR